MPPKSVPWVELYRPKALDQVSHQVEVVATLQSAVKTGQLPHLLLVGFAVYRLGCVFLGCIMACIDFLILFCCVVVVAWTSRKRENVRGIGLVQTAVSSIPVEAAGFGTQRQR